MNPIFLEEVRQALHLSQFDSVAAQCLMKPVPRSMARAPQRQGRPRQGAVLLLLFEHQDRLKFVLTRRRENLNSHAGQISLPGGRREEGESLEEAAVREAREEIGIDPQTVTILGRLTPLYIAPSDFEVHPFVGWYARTPEYVPQHSEVAEIIEAPLVDILDGNARREEIWERNDITMQVPYFNIAGHKVWGATAMMLSEFAERLRMQCNGSLATL